jgi:hypothetical protein
MMPAASHRKEFRPKTAMWLSLPGAIFWSMVASLYILPAFPNFAPFSYAHKMLDSWWGGLASSIIGISTPFWNILAMFYALYWRGQDVARRCFFAFNAAGLVALIAVVSSLKRTP